MRRGQQAAVVVGGMLLLVVTGCSTARDGAQAQTVQDNMVVTMEYALTVEGREIDSSRGQPPFSYIQGRHQIVPGLERALAGLRLGQEKDIVVQPAEGHGEFNPNAAVKVPREKLPATTTPQVGNIVNGQDDQGRPIVGVVKAVGPKEITLDMNHPLAGKVLRYHVHIIRIVPAAMPATAPAAASTPATPTTSTDAPAGN